MNKAQFFFKAVDVIGYHPQNLIHFKNVVCVKDIPYGEAQLNKGDLYFDPDKVNDSQKHPIVVYYHGGGFIMGDKKYRVSVAEYYADKGYYVYNVNYRMAPDFTYVNMVEDCVQALNFIEELALEYNIDTDNIVLTGDSSGGFLTSYVTALKYDEELRKVYSIPEIKPNIKGIMLMCGIYDIEVLLQGTTLFGIIPQTASILLDYKIKKDLSNVKDYPMYEYLSPASFINEKWCPAFICWADDDLVCQNQGEPMAKKLEEFVPFVRKYHCSGIINNHCYHLVFKGSKYAKECMSQSVDFLEEVTRVPATV